MEKKVINSSVWYLFSSLITQGINFFTIPLFTRLLSINEFGYFSNFSSWLGIITVLVTLNLHSTLNRARFDFKKEFADYVSSMLVLGTIVTCIFYFIVYINKNFFVNIFSMDFFSIQLMFFYLLVFPAFSIFQTLQILNYKYKMNVFLSIMLTISTISLSIILVMFMDDKYLGRVLGSIIPGFILALIIYILLFYKGRNVRISYFRYALIVCIPYLPHLISMNILSTIDRVMITNYFGNEYTAIYSIAYTCGLVINLLINSINNAISPWIGEQIQLCNWKKIKSNTSIIMIMFVYFSFGLMLFGPEIINVLGGKMYSDALSIVPIVSVSCIIQFFYTLFVNIEQFERKTIGMAIATCCAAVINIVLNYLLLPKFGYKIAAYTTLISYLFLLIFHQIYVYCILKIKCYNFKLIFFLVFLSTCMIIIYFFLYEWNLLRYFAMFIYIITLIYISLRNKSLIVLYFIKH